MGEAAVSQLRLDNLTGRELAAVCAASARERDGFPHFNYVTGDAVPVFAPVVHCCGRVDGETVFAAIFPRCTVRSASAILAALDWERTARVTEAPVPSRAEVAA